MPGSTLASTGSRLSDEPMCSMNCSTSPLSYLIFGRTA